MEAKTERLSLVQKILELALIGNLLFWIDNSTKRFNKTILFLQETLHVDRAMIIEKETYEMKAISVGFEVLIWFVF